MRRSRTFQKEFARLAAIEIPLREKLNVRYTDQTPNMDTPIPREVEQPLPRPLRPSEYEPVAPPRRRGRRGRVELQEFDPYPPHGNRIITNYQNELVDLFNQPIVGVEVKLGRRYIRWFLSQGLEENLTPTIMGKFREKVDTAFYICYIYAIKIRNIEDGTIMVYYMRKRGSPWMNTFAEAENWLNDQENGRLSLENIERPNTKWVFVEFFNVDVKVVLDRRPLQLLGTGPLPDWLRNLARGRANQWLPWIPTTTTCVSGAALLITMELDQIEAHQQLVSLQRVPLNSTPLQTTCQKHHLMNWIRLKGISIIERFTPIG